MSEAQTTQELLDLQQRMFAAVRPCCDQVPQLFDAS